MRIELRIDSITHSIDSVNPDLLGQWIVEILGRWAPNWSPATWCTVQVWPSWIGGKPDWIADTRVIGGYETIDRPDPQLIVDAMQRWVNNWKGLQHQ